jgi:uncharacterized phage protein (TIGR02220 family)
MKLITIDLDKESITDLSKEELNLLKKLVDNSLSKKVADESKLDYKKLMDYFNIVFKKQTRVVTDKAKSNLAQRLKEGYEKSAIRIVIDNASNDNHHIESNYKYITLEFLSRPNIFERYASQIHQKPYSVKKEIGHTNH